MQLLLISDLTNSIHIFFDIFSPLPSAPGVTSFLQNKGESLSLPLTILIIPICRKLSFLDISNHVR